MTMYSLLNWRCGHCHAVTNTLRFAWLLVVVLLMGMSIHAQDTPPPYVQGAFAAAQTALERDDTPVNWSFQQAATTTNRGLSCTSAQDTSDLGVEIIPWRVVVEFGDGVSVVIFTSSDGTLATLCDAALGAANGRSIDVSPTGCRAQLTLPTALKRAPLEIAANLADLEAQAEGAVLGISNDGLWYHMAFGGIKGWIPIASLNTEAFVDTAPDNPCSDLPQTGVAGILADLGGCYVSPLSTYANVRSQPRVDGDLLTQIYANSIYEARATNGDGTWYLLDVGWIYGVVSVTQGNCAGLLAAEDDAYQQRQAAIALASGTPQPTATSTATPPAVTNQAAQPTAAPLSATTRFITSDSSVTSVAVADDGAIYYAAGNKVYLADFDNQLGTVFIEAAPDASLPITNIRFANATTLVIALATGDLQLWDVSGNAPNAIRTIVGGFNPLATLTGIFDGSLQYYLTTACQTAGDNGGCVQGAINLHDGNTGDIIRVQPAHPSVPTAVAFVGADDAASLAPQIASLGADGVQYWDTMGGAFVTAIGNPAPSARFYGASIGTNGDVVWAQCETSDPACGTASISYVNAADGVIQWSTTLTPVQAGSMKSIAQQPASDAADGRIALLWQGEGGTFELVVMNGGDGVIMLQAALALPDAATGIALSADGSRVYVATAVGIVMIDM